MRRNALAVIVAVFLCAAAFPDGSFAATTILGIRHWTAPEYTRVVIDTSGEARYSVMEANASVIVDVANTKLARSLPREYILNKPAVTKVLVTPRGKDAVRVELQVAANVKVNVFFLKAVLDKPNRIVIDVKLPQLEEKASEERKLIRVTEKKKVVVIDPGHGGEDPGAVGRKGTQEKDVVLKIARRLRERLAKKGYHAVLTRDGDYFISLRKRGDIARECGADLFISVHADASRKRGVRGTSVYRLSTGGASNEAARLLAQNENLSDIVGGSSNGATRDESNPIALDMLQSETLNRSRLLGEGMLFHLKKINYLKFDKVQDAPFVVLKLPDVPSVLVETAYISNPREENLLRSAAYQIAVADAMTSAVMTCAPIGRGDEEAVVVETPVVEAPVSVAPIVEPVVEKKPEKPSPPIVKVSAVKEKPAKHSSPAVRASVAKEKPEKPSPPAAGASHRVYIVKRGDTLRKIAEREKTTVQALAALNAIAPAKPILVGQRLKLPVAETRAVIYVVKKGDTLTKIAVRHKTTVDALMKRNRLASPRVVVGQKLSIS
ncbi:MAG: N-acetylmuramoyl-L-alanine amidase [Deltaproteobacteria bacterium]|nr:N-acetylmuramoyl-L-alanine amidase [Deltaproteobacteria bacterium]